MKAFLESARLGEVCSFLSGGTPSKSEERYFSGDIPWITGADITGPVVTTARNFITKEAVAASATNQVPAGTVLLVTRTSVGKVAIAGKSLCFSQDITALKPKGSKLDPGFLVQFLKTKEDHFDRYARGATIKGITRDVVADLKIPMLPLSEQRRIAAILDQAETLRSQRRAAQAELDSLAQSVFLDMFGDVNGLPKFPVATIRQSVEASSGKSSKAVVCASGDGFPIYGGNGVNGWASRPLYAEPVLVFGRVGQQCGNAFITEGPAWVTDNAIVVRITQAETLDATYLLHAFQMTGFSARVKHLDLPFINQGMILDAPVPLPPFAVQQTFATRIQAIEALKATHRAALAELDALFASLQHRAFAGRL